MVRSRTGTGRWRAARWAAVALLGASAALVGVAPAQAAGADLRSGSLTWGFKASFRAYLNTGNGNPPIAASEGASINGDGTFTFPVKGGTYDADTGALDARYGGKIVFSYPAHFFTISLANPTIVVSGGTAAVTADVDLLTTAAEPVSVRQATIATIAVTDGNPGGSGGTVTATDLAATLTAEGASAFNGFYSAGSALDPLSFTASTGGGSGPAGPAVGVTPATGLDPSGATITVTGSGFDPEANGAAGIYVSFGPKVDQHWTNAGVLQVTKWVNKTNEPTEARDRLNADGTFRTTLPISAVYTDRTGAQVDCTKVQCYVVTFAARGAADRSQDTFTPVTFARTPVGGGDADQQITTTVTGGALTLGVAGSTVALPAVSNGQVTTGALNAATVADLRGTNAGWSLVGQASDFASASGGTIAADNLGWVPSATVGTDPLAGTPGVVTPGAAAAPGAGLGTARALCTSATGASNGTFTCGAQLNLGVPASAPAGEYSAVLTLTLS
ncbi:HtaA domain-containing protein [Micromonospora sp. WMMD987]|uniref:HtaA domain-containing protein n=1 Tax=Micromonospora TaxID=1873 RepID=UPI00249AD793|nr:HtaA domain-containing protein [Micromonospora sp. WMMD987]WFE97691.1 HtaA domain-containing protein [Micromonospora sp. WMMD987]